jgi:hypothetical protein
MPGVRAPVAVVLAAAVLLTGCGGSKHKGKSAAKQTASPSATSTTGAAKPPAAKPTTANPTGPKKKATFSVSLKADNARPKAGTPWHFVVNARTRKGRPVAGTAIVRVLMQDNVVDTVGWFGFKGTLRRTYRWSPKLRGTTVELQAKIVGTGGTSTASYLVTVR